ncbi:hypothetical protein GRI97_09610 [Altererythrobacter xixiisoli]|uniref:Uncharacterized protein n=1 Tax=Croceibacterium xixiisoli TaxID=1476466 RepID=A0A6I4TTM7_9SPHN|nr:hypothetical protein [Croceibacterium xixiisoli]MXO99244.1 hypothetical protein [Croceibacterium xixiisoli]
MADLVTQNWVLFVLALIIGLIIAWWIFAASRRTRVTLDRDPAEETGPAKRNQALIDAPPAALRDRMPPPAQPVPAAPVATPVPVAPPAPPPSDQAIPVTPTEAPSLEEPIAPFDAVDAPVTTPQTPEPATDGADDLTRIKGLGPKIADILREMNITSYAEIAAWDDAAIDRVDAGLGRFQGRIRRDNWVEQARHLAAGDIAGYEGAFGKL